MLCTNLMLSAHDILVNLKQTIHANIKKAITAGVANFMIQAGHLDRRLDELARTSYSDQMAKAVMCDLAVTAVAPNYLKDAYTAYFEEKPEDCSPRSAWGVMNAWTRALRKANGVTKVEHTQAVAKYFDC